MGHPMLGIADRVSRLLVGVTNERQAREIIRREVNSALEVPIPMCVSCNYVIYIIRIIRRVISLYAAERGGGRH